MIQNAHDGKQTSEGPSRVLEGYSSCFIHRYNHKDSVWHGEQQTKQSLARNYLTPKALRKKK
jgi:hypothetical protein